MTKKLPKELIILQLKKSIKIINIWADIIFFAKIIEKLPIKKNLAFQMLR